MGRGLSVKTKDSDGCRRGLWALKVAHRVSPGRGGQSGGCVKSHSPYYKSPPEARMASSQSDFIDFLGLFTQPQIGEKHLGHKWRL